MNGISLVAERPAVRVAARLLPGSAVAAGRAGLARRWGLALAAGQTLLNHGQRGPLWRVAEGWLVLLRPDEPEARPIQLAGPGDLVGVASLVDASYGESAVALTPVRADPALWLDAAEQHALARVALRQQQRQAFEMSLVRSGTVRERLRHLLALLAPPGGALERQALPSLKVLAQIVDSAPETVCRELGHLFGGEAPRPPKPRKPRRAVAARVTPLAACA